MATRSHAGGRAHTSVYISNNVNLIYPVPEPPQPRSKKRSRKRGRGGQPDRGVRTGHARLAAALAAFLLALCQAASAANLIDIANDITDPDNSADAEPSIAVDPNNPRNISVVTISSDSNAWIEGRNAIVWQSKDGGATWMPSRILPPPPPPYNDWSWSPGDHNIAYDSSGRLFVTLLVTDLTQRKDFIYRPVPGSADLMPGMPYGDDDPHLDIDKVSSSRCFGTLYSPWLNTHVNPWQSTVGWSSDQGNTITKVPVGAMTSANSTTRIALAPDGKAYVVYRLGGVLPLQPTAPPNAVHDAAFVVHRSDDCGRTWNALPNSPITVHPTATVRTFFATGWGAGKNMARAQASDAWIAVDRRSGDVYVAHVSVDASSFGQIYVARSTDNGQTWAETRVTDGTSHSAYPEIAIADNGTIGVLYIDYTVPPGSADALFRHRFASSFDKGRHWTEQTLQIMDPSMLSTGKTRPAPWTDGLLWGDYEGLTAVGNTFYGVFTGASIGRTQAQPDPIFFTEAATMPPALIITILAN
jgi:hypothetical protein